MRCIDMPLLTCDVFTSSIDTHRLTCRYWHAMYSYPTIDMPLLTCDVIKSQYWHAMYWHAAIDMRRIHIPFWAGYHSYPPWNHRSLLQDIVSCIGLLCTRDPYVYLRVKCMCSHEYVCLSMCVPTPMCVRACVYVYVCTNIHTCMHVYIYTYICIYVHIYIHT